MRKAVGISHPYGIQSENRLSGEWRRGHPSRSLNCKHELAKATDQRRINNRLKLVRKIGRFWKTKSIFIAMGDIRASRLFLLSNAWFLVPFLFLLLSFFLVPPFLSHSLPSFLLFTPLSLCFLFSCFLKNYCCLLKYTQLLFLCLGFQRQWLNVEVVFVFKVGFVL